MKMYVVYIYIYIERKIRLLDATIFKQFNEFLLLLMRIENKIGICYFHGEGEQ
jgi:hypothetical protein